MWSSWRPGSSARSPLDPLQREVNDTSSRSPSRVRSRSRGSSAMEGVKHASSAVALAAGNNTNRRALRDIRNIISAPHQHHHLAVAKRGLHEKPSAADAKNQPGGFAGHRPGTRKFVAALATRPANAPLVIAINAIEILAVLIPSLSVAVLYLRVEVP